MTTTIDLSAVQFEPLLKIIKHTDNASVHGVAWAELYVAADGRPFAIYASGSRLVTRNARPAEYIVEFYDNDGAAEYTNRRYRVAMATLAQRGGIQQEAARARYYLVRAFDSTGGVHVLQKQRAVAFATPATKYNY